MSVSEARSMKANSRENNSNIHRPKSSMIAKSSDAKPGESNRSTHLNHFKSPASNFQSRHNEHRRALIQDLYLTRMSIMILFGCGASDK